MKVRQKIITRLEIAFLAFFALMGTSCAPSWWKEAMEGTGFGGGQDSVIVFMPFDSNYQAVCVQGAWGGYSHIYPSTCWDVDMDTPNDSDELVYAPISGTANVRNDPNSGFGIHLNIDLSDGTYITLDHLKEVFVENGEEVAVGQMLGFEGSTGDSQGDHVHMGRHAGDASLDAGAGESIEGLIFEYASGSSGAVVNKATSQIHCDLATGEVMESTLLTPRWHPNGTLVMTPFESTVYVIEDGVARAFLTEDIFWSYNYSFDNVALISQEELDCYESSNLISSQMLIEAVQDGGDAWLVVGGAADSERYKQRLSSLEMANVLRSWGLSALDGVDQLPSTVDVGLSLAGYPTASGVAPMRDGTLVSEVGESDVYVISSGVAMPIADWDALLLMDFYNREILEVNNGSVSGLHEQVGNCSVDVYCLTREDILTCGGSLEDAWDESVSTSESDTDTDSDADSDADSDTDSDTDADSDADSDTDADSDSDTDVDVDTLHVSWTAPSMMDRITLSGEYTESVGGFSFGWMPDMQTEWNAEEIVYDFYGAQPYDTFRFSVEFEDVSMISWSCLAPFPPGTLQGNPQAFYGSVEVPVVAMAAPFSNGCELFVEVP